MSVSTTLKSYLDKNKIPYETLTHEEVYTSQETAEKQDVPGQNFAKCVVINWYGKYALAVLPSTHRVNLEKLSQEMGGKEMKLATEDEFGKLFPDCDLGAMPPMGQIYDMPVWVDKLLAKDEWIVFNAGSHTDTIRMKFDDFKKWSKPKILSFGEKS